MNRPAKDTKAKSTKTSTRATSKSGTAVVVLGMHRSGTSALAGVLTLMGCDGPTNQMKPTKDNEKGYFESGQIYGMHTQLLESAGSRWDDWLAISPQWYKSVRAEEYRDRAVALVKTEFKGSRLFALKDPRICRLVPFWEEVLAECDAAPAYVLTHRNPLEVAASLASRDGLDESIGMLIWLRHVLDAEAATRGKKRCFVSYDFLMGGWGAAVQRIQAQLDLTLPRFAPGAAPEVDEFLDRKLRHQNHSARQVIENPMLSAWVREAYDVLERWVASEEDPKDYPKLDALRDTLDSAASTFAPMTAAALVRRDVENETSTLEQKLAEASDALDKLNAETDLVRQQNKILHAKVTHLTAEQASTHKAMLDAQAAQKAEQQALEQERDALQTAATADQARIETLEAKGAALEEELGQVKSALEQRSHEAEESHKELSALKAEKADNDNRIVEVKTALARSQSQLAEESGKIDTLKRQLQDQTSKATALDGKLKSQYREMADLSRILRNEEDRSKEQITTLTNRSEYAESAYDLITKSTSWRLTRPLRVLTRLVRRR